MIVYSLLPDGGFVCGDTESRLTSYAYPSSINALAAKKYPQAVAILMVAGESEWTREGNFAKEYDNRNWVKLIPENGKV